MKCLQYSGSIRANLFKPQCHLGPNPKHVISSDWEGRCSIFLKTFGEAQTKYPSLKNLTHWCWRALIKYARVRLGAEFTSCITHFIRFQVNPHKSWWKYSVCGFALQISTKLSMIPSSSVLYIRNQSINLWTAPQSTGILAVLSVSVSERTL